MFTAFFRHAAVLVLAFDITCAPSFYKLDTWFKASDDKIRSTWAAKEYRLAIVGCKSDLDGERAISKEEALEYAREKGCSYFETSSLADDGVSCAFERMAAEYLDVHAAHGLHFGVGTRPKAVRLPAAGSPLLTSPKAHDDHREDKPPKSFHTCAC